LHGKIPKSNLEALQILKEKGYLTFICTGRASFYASSLFKDLVSGIICCNGRYIIYHNEKILGVQFSEEELNEYINIFHQLDCGYMLVSDYASSVNNMDNTQIDEVIHEYGENHIVFKNNYPFYTFDLFYKNLTQRDTIMNTLKDKIICNDHNGHGSMDCSTINFDKGHAIAYLLDYFHIDKDHAYAFGDGYNDQAMFREVNHKIAMGNGVDVLKQKATYITDNIENEGIMKALIHEKVI
jgi:hypothetical protein